MAKTGGGGTKGGGGSGSGGSGNSIWVEILKIVAVPVIGAVIDVGRNLMSGDRKLKKKLKNLDRMLRKGQLSQEEYNKLRERLIHESQTKEI